MTELVKGSYRVMCELISSSRPNLVAFLINFHGVSVDLHCPLNTASRELVGG